MEFPPLEIARLGVECGIFIALMTIKNDMRHVWRNIEALWNKLEKEKS